MIQFGKGVVKFRIPIIILSLALLVPSVFGILHTRVNYDILSYLPGDIETMVGQDILVDEFQTGAFSLCVVEGMEWKEVSALKEKIEAVEHVSSVVWYDSIADLSLPMEVIPESFREFFVKGDSTLLAFLQKEERVYTEILDRLQGQGLDCDKRRMRYAEVETLLAECRRAKAIALRGAGCGS